MAELEVLALSIFLPPWLDDEAAARAERHRGHPRIRAQLRLVVGVQAHAVLAGPVAIDEDVVERRAGFRATRSRSRRAAGVKALGSSVCPEYR